jgi:hypothetical protein
MLKQTQLKAKFPKQTFKMLFWKFEIIIAIAIDF